MHVSKKEKSFLSDHKRKTMAIYVAMKFNYTKIIIMNKSNFKQISVVNYLLCV